MATPDLERSATHLAGHILARVVFDLPFTVATLPADPCALCVPSPPSSPSPNTNGPANEDLRLRWRTAIACLAGAEADRLDSETQRPTPQGMYLALNIAALLVPFSANLLHLMARVGQARRAAQKLLAHKRQLHRTLVAALKQQGSLDWSEAQRLADWDTIRLELQSIDLPQLRRDVYALQNDLGVRPNAREIDDEGEQLAQNHWHSGADCMVCGNVGTLCPDCGLCEECCTC